MVIEFVLKFAKKIQANHQLRVIKFSDLRFAQEVNIAVNIALKVNSKTNQGLVCLNKLFRVSFTFI
jgi:hypothetical protein